METELKMESSGSDADKKLKLAKSIVIIATVIMTIMAIVIIMDHAKLIKAQNAYNIGYNECAQICNTRINLYRERCGMDVPREIENSTPVLNESFLNKSILTDNIVMVTVGE